MVGFLLLVVVVVVTGTVTVTLAGGADAVSGGGELETPKGKVLEVGGSGVYVLSGRYEVVKSSGLLLLPFTTLADLGARCSVAAISLQTPETGPWW